jgi:hypothetical protein|tara:strand:- start:282 stop:485 length:204 start_codon:yes stop_codon:yes gene_type:complete
MIPVNRETMLVVGVIICAAAIIFLFNELKKTRDEVNSVKQYSLQITKEIETKPPQIEEVEEDVKSEE